MKTSKLHLFQSWLLLLCFVAGQYMVYTHQHRISKSTIKTYIVANASTSQSVTEKCTLCDAMHHTVMLTSHNVHFDTTKVTEHFFKQVSYKFTSIQLILAGGRAPPIAIYSA